MNPRFRSPVGLAVLLFAGGAVHCGSSVSLGTPSLLDAGSQTPGAPKPDVADGPGGVTRTQQCVSSPRVELVRELGKTIGLIHGVVADSTDVFYVVRVDDNKSVLKRVSLQSPGTDALGTPTELLSRAYIGELALVGDDVVFNATRDDGTARATWFTLARIPKAGGAVVTLGDADDNAAFCCGQDSQKNVTFGLWNGGIDSPTSPDLVTISPNGKRTVVARTLPGVQSIASDGTVILTNYVLAQQLSPVARPARSEIWSTPAAGGVSTRIWGPADRAIGALTLHDAHVYFATDSGIARLPVAGPAGGSGDTEELVRSTRHPAYSLKIDGGYMYWMTGITYQNRTSALFRAPTAGGGVVESLEENIREGYEYAVGRCEIVWAADGAGGTSLWSRAK